MAAVTIVKHLWWDATRTRLVEHGDPDAAFLAFAPGDAVPEADARRLGLVVASTDPADQPDPVGQAGAKTRRTPPRNKLGPAPEDKAPTNSVEES